MEVNLFIVLFGLGVYYVAYSGLELASFLLG